MKTKKSIKILLSLTLSVLFILLAGACSAMDYGSDYSYPTYTETQSDDEFTEYTENTFINAAEHPVSYFSMDVSTSSYSVIRNYINNNLTINKNMVNLEEMVNYFRYSYSAPENGKPLSINGNIFPCPWNSESLLCSVGLKAKDIEFENIRNNLVFLIDTSGSMDSPEKIGLLKESFYLLADNLNDNDIISIVTYAGSSKVPLEGASGHSGMRIKNIISDLSAGGSTGGAGGIRRAYELAEKYFIEGGNNRVILATDGDFNVGISNQDDLKEFITEKRSQSKGVYLSVMGFGLGNLKDTTMDTLAQNGNGAAYYIDGLLEAKKVMVEEMKGTLVTVADDVKAAVEFNPDKISSYRLLGYETKLLTEDDWNNDSADAGEIGAGHTVTAVYEIKLTEGADGTSEHTKLGNNYFKAQVRYKEPYAGERPESDTRQVKEISCLMGKNDVLSAQAFAQNEDLTFISCVIEFGLILRNSTHKGSSNISSIIERLETLDSVVDNEYRADFLSLVKKYRPY